MDPLGARLDEMKFALDGFIEVSHAIPPVI